jgi:hypothetical protein
MKLAIAAVLHTLLFAVPTVLLSPLRMEMALLPDDAPTLFEPLL